MVVSVIGSEVVFRNHGRSAFAEDLHFSCAAVRSQDEVSESPRGVRRSVRGRHLGPMSSQSLGTVISPLIIA